MSTVLVPYEDIKKPRFDNHLYSFLCEPANIKWFLVAIVFYSLAIFNMFFSQLSTAKAEAVLKKMQLLSSAAFSLGHGGNDSQKVMGWFDLNVVLPSEKDGIKIDGHMPEWIPLTCYTVIALGTLSGGWKIVKTMGSKITKVTAFEGVVAESAGALTLFSTEHFKIPVSTTHTIAGLGY